MLLVAWYLFLSVTFFSTIRLVYIFKVYHRSFPIEGGKRSMCTCSSVTDAHKCYVKLWYMWKNILQCILVKLECLNYSTIDMNYFCAIQRSSSAYTGVVWFVFKNYLFFF